MTEANLNEKNPNVETTILIADDDPGIREALAIRIRSAGYQVITAADSYQAVQFIQQHRPALVILDINMPAGDGFSVQDRMNTICGTKPLPVIYVTGDATLETKARAEALGAIALLTKPVDSEMLLSCVASAVLNCSPVPVK